MSRPRYFAIVATMRTGSNLLQRSLNQFPDLICHGELFNPAFVGGPGQDSFHGITREDRDRDPLALIERMIGVAGGRIPGFRIFDDHDARVLAHIAADPACARVVLTRPAEESFVSLLIAQKTGQWLLTDPDRRRSARVTVDPDALAAWAARVAGFHDRFARMMRSAGQTAFAIRHDELKDLALINGLAAHLGSAHRLERIAPTLVRQNPGPLSAHVTNPEALTAATPRAERVPRVDARGLLLAGGVVLAPLPGVAAGPARRWLEAAAGPVRSGLSRARLQAEARKGRIGSVVALTRHPFARIHAAFRDCIAWPDGKGFPRIRAALVRDHGLALPGPDRAGDIAAHRAAFAAFLSFLEDNLAGRSTIRIDPVWAPQVDCLRALAAVLPVTLVLRPGQGAEAGRFLRRVHRLGQADDRLLDAGGPGRLVDAAEIWTPELGRAVARLYPDDHALVGARGDSPPPSGGL
ncbi:MAG: hypothetical protein KatS3mg118_3746 [Paracoccaceae bacterium]|nr:MAG: hypothetical protein KatS3mg118_3746 [Paracoccaceae bacterium]